MLSGTEGKNMEDVWHVGMMQSTMLWWRSGSQCVLIH